MTSDLISPSALEAIVFIIAATILYFQNKKQEKNVKQVKQTLTDKNGGSSVRDRLDAQDKKLDEVVEQVTKLTAAAETVATKFDYVDIRLSGHLKESVEHYDELKRKGYL